PRGAPAGSLLTAPATQLPGSDRPRRHRDRGLTAAPPSATLVQVLVPFHPMARLLKISEARRTLFDLVDDVIERADEVILIQHRDRKERVALVNESYIEYLRATIEALKAGDSDEFRLAGSMRLLVAEDELEASIGEL